jgi:hypothetical protein
LARRKRQLSRVWSNTGLWTDLGIPQFWNRETDGPFGVVIRGWKFAKCGSFYYSSQMKKIANFQWIFVYKKRQK